MYQYLSPSETTEICLVAVIVLRAIFDCHISVLKDFSWHSVLSFLLVFFFFFLSQWSETEVQVYLKHFPDN